MAIIYKFPVPERKIPAAAPSHPAPRHQAAYNPEKQKRGANQAESQRKAMLAKVHIARKQLAGKLAGFNEDTYRYMLRERWDVESSGDMTNAQLAQLVAYLRELGFVPTRGSARRGADRTQEIPALLIRDETGLDRVPLMRRIEQLLAEKGRQENKFVSWNYARGILQRQTKGLVTEFDLATPKQLKGVIGALERTAAYSSRKRGN